MRFILKHEMGTKSQIEAFAQKKKLRPRHVISVQTNDEGHTIMWYWNLENNGSV